MYTHARTPKIILYSFTSPCTNSHNSRFTARMSELLTVLSDMEKGVYERTMVSSQPSESTEDGTGRKREREREREGERRREGEGERERGRRRGREKGEGERGTTCT